MRIASIGIPLPNAQVDNHSIANAPSLFDYDAVVIDLRRVSEQIEAIAEGSAEFRAPDGRPVQPGAGGAFRFGLGELLQQRRDELQRLVDRGGVILALTYPNVPHPTVTTLPGLDRYYILPAPSGVVYRPPALLPGDGQQLVTADPRHAAAVYLDDLAGRLRYRAHWDINAIPNFERVGHVLAKSAGGATVGVELAIGPGRLLLLPPVAAEPSGSDRAKLTNTLIETLQRSLDTPRGEPAPGWLRNYELPKLREARERAAEARAAFAEAESVLVEAEAFLTDASKFHALLWRSGRHAFDATVRDAFRALGFTVTTDLEQPPEIKDGDQVALVEIESSSTTISERPYLALQRRIEQAFLKKASTAKGGERPKGVIVVNGERMADPRHRRQPYSATLANACETFGYALIPAEALFALVTYALEGADADTLADIRTTILTTAGLLDVEDAAELDEVADTVPGPEDAPEPVTAEADSGD